MRVEIDETLVGVSKQFDSGLICFDAGFTIETHTGVSLEALIELLDSFSGVFQVNFSGRILPFGVVEMVGSNVHSGGSEISRVFVVQKALK